MGLYLLMKWVLPGIPVQNGPSGHSSTGIFGAKYVLETLSEQLSPGVIFDIVNSTNYPAMQSN